MLQKLSHYLLYATLVLCGTVLGARASASPILWTLSGVTFADGGTASGSFDYDAATNTYSLVNITTTGGSITGATYLALDPGFASTSGILSVVPNAGLGDFTGTPLLALGFGPHLSALGGTSSILAGSGEGTCINTTCSMGTSLRNVTAGSVTAVPEPSTLTLLGAALLGLGCLVTFRQRCA